MTGSCPSHYYPSAPRVLRFKLHSALIGGFGVHRDTAWAWSGFGNRIFEVEAPRNPVWDYYAEARLDCTRRWSDLWRLCSIKVRASKQPRVGTAADQVHEGDLSLFPAK
jgi:hypothetical protein